MAHIIAGYLQQQDQVADLVKHLIAAGFPEDKISSFYVNPAGQHDLFPGGGDEDKSPGALDSVAGMGKGMAAGGVIGGTVGVATAPVTGPLGAIAGALVGAHVGSLVGSMNAMKDAGESEAHSNANLKPQRHSGMLVAINLKDSAREGVVLNIYHAHRAEHIERAEGVIFNGDWADFDPLRTPVLIEPAQKSLG
jgi:hypothetical protein